MIYTFDLWLDVVMPYPTLSRSMGNAVLINDIIKTDIPDIIFGCFPVENNPHYINLREYLCYLDDNGKLVFDDDSTVIGIFRNSIPQLDQKARTIINERYYKKF